MKKLLKVILPPTIGFGLYFLGIRYKADYFDLRISEIGTGTLQGFEAYYRYALPLLFVIAVLTQLLIVKPIWDSMQQKPAWGKITAFICLVILCLLFASTISYAIWDKPDGTEHLVKLIAFMTAVQLVYWGIDLFILFMLE